MSYRLVLAVVVAGIVSAGGGAVTAAGGSDPLVIRGRVVDVGGDGVEGATLGFSRSYGLVLGPGGFSGGSGGGEGDPACDGNQCIAVTVRTGPDGRFSVDAPSDIVEARDDIDDGETGGFSLTVEAPAATGEVRGPVVQVSHRLGRKDREIELPTMRLWRPQMRAEPLPGHEVRLRWSRLSSSYGRRISDAAAGITEDSSTTVSQSGPAAARVDLRVTPPGAGWFVSGATQVGDKSNMAYSSAALRLPAPPTPPSRGRPCLVIGSAGTALRGPCATTDGDADTSPGVVFRNTCRPDAVFCEREVPTVTAVDLGSVVELSFIRAVGKCHFSCTIVLSTDGVTWREAQEAEQPKNCRPGRGRVIASPREQVVPPAGTRARYVGLSGGDPDRIPPARPGGGRIPSTSAPFDPDAGGIESFQAVDLAEVTVWTAPPSGATCKDGDEDLAPLGLPPGEEARERNTLLAKVIAGLAVFVVALGLVRARQRSRRP